MNLIALPTLARLAFVLDTFLQVTCGYIVRGGGGGSLLRLIPVFRRSRGGASFEVIKLSVGGHEGGETKYGRRETQGDVYESGERPCCYLRLC